jgi:hypothetical protein
MNVECHRATDYSGHPNSGRTHRALFLATAVIRSFETGSRVYTAAGDDAGAGS